jgi:MoaA/NifB/PqqE/SkfB family radical SAM enzyme
VSDEFRIDSHKLLFHPREIARWLDGGIVYPIYMEISPSGACNHRCTFCALDFMGYQPRFLDFDILKERLTELGRLGLKSLMLGGEGEPLLHRDCAEIVTHARKSGIDVALTTNGVLLNRSFCEQALGSMSWIKVSIDAGTSGTYARIHRTKEADFATVMDNLSAAVRIAGELNSSCVIGAQMLLFPENAGEVDLLAKLCRDAGLKYLVIKPYSQHGRSLTREYEGVDYGPFLAMQERLAPFNTSSFSVIFRAGTMRKAGAGVRGYDRCRALPFWSYIDSGGDVWGCSAWLGDDRFRYGNINEQSIEEIWNGARRRESLAFVEGCLDPEACRVNCRMDEVNRYLWELTHPSAHVNFI